MPVHWECSELDPQSRSSMVDGVSGNAFLDWGGNVIAGKNAEESQA